jgi:uncharacterized membrane protein
MGGSAWRPAFFMVTAAGFRHKKSPLIFRFAGLNPIQRELEETELILPHGNIFILFIFVITVISKTNNWKIKSPQAYAMRAFCLLSHPEVDFF